MQLCLKPGEILETAKKKIVLGKEHIDLKPEDIGGWIRHRGWTISVDPTSHLIWPVYPFDPYRDDFETSLTHAVGAVPRRSGSRRLPARNSPRRKLCSAFKRMPRRRPGGLPAPRSRPRSNPTTVPCASTWLPRPPAWSANCFRASAMADFEKIRPALRSDYLYMLGLAPLPERTPLHATVTGKLKHRDGCMIEKLHFQSSPGLYVTANLYLPHGVKGPAPTILYLCGHYSQMKRDGNKAAPDCQSHALWFATHGYVVLVLDTLELGEIAAIHRGTLRLNRWWWHSAGYTPAGVECWNAMCALDYLVTRPEVDPERIGATGISGGGAVTFWVAAADERVKAAAPVSGMSDVMFYAGEGGVGVHCDCIMFYNRARWNWANVAALIAPRPLLFVNSDNDVYFPLPGVERMETRLERLYARFGAGDKVASVLSMGGHGYRTDIRRAEYGFFNRYLKLNPRPVEDPDAWVMGRNVHPIAPDELGVFATDADLPKDQLNTRIDETFVVRGQPGVPSAATFETWRRELLGRVKKASFAAWPGEPPHESVQNLGVWRSTAGNHGERHRGRLALAAGQGPFRRASSDRAQSRRRAGEVAGLGFSARGR